MARQRVRGKTNTLNVLLKEDDKMILCCGEALIDMIPSDHEVAFKPLAGGAVFNTAIGIGRQGVDVGLLSGVSTDLFGTILENALEESGVNTSYLNRSWRPTTCLLYTSPSPRDQRGSRMPSSA